jgi:hypothetical protein
MMGKGRISGLSAGALIALALSGRGAAGPSVPRTDRWPRAVSQKVGKPTSNRKARLLAAALKRKERES